MGGFFNRFDATKVSVTASDLEVDGGTLSVDEVNNRVGIGTTAPGCDLHVNNESGATEVRFDAEAGEVVTLNMQQGGGNVGTLQVGAGGEFVIQNQSNNKDIVFKAKDNNVTYKAITIDASEMEVIINDGHEPTIDFRVEGDTNTHMLFVDSSEDSVIIDGSTVHAASFVVDGDASAIALKEMADAPADVAAFGQIWVNTATPNELYFTTDAGDDIQLTSGTAVAGGGADANDVSAIIATQVFS
jgi:hypothetical protein